MVVEVLSTEPVIANEFKDDTPDTLNEFNAEDPETDNTVIVVFARVLVPVEVSPFKLVEPDTVKAVTEVVESVERPVAVTVVKLAVGAVNVEIVVFAKVLFPVACKVFRIVAPDTVSEAEVTEANVVEFVTVKLYIVELADTERVFAETVTNVEVP